MSEIPASMRYINVPKVKSLTEVWEEDKRLANMGLEGKLPDQDAIRRIAERILPEMQSPSLPVRLSGALLIDILSPLFGLKVTF